MLNFLSNFVRNPLNCIVARLNINIILLKLVNIIDVHKPDMSILRFFIVEFYWET